MSRKPRTTPENNYGYGMLRPSLPTKRPSGEVDPASPADWIPIGGALDILTASGAGRMVMFHALWRRVLAGLIPVTCETLTYHEGGERITYHMPGSGMMSLDEVAAYIADVRRACVTHRLREYAMVIDVRDCPIQQQDTIRSMVDHMATMPKARALAIVTGRSLAKMQVRRVFTQPYARIVDTIEQGQAWVVRQVEPMPA